MKVIEQFAAAKSGNEEKCEDGIAVAEHFAAVVDGVTDKTGARFDGVAGGRFAMLVLVEAVHALDKSMGTEANANADAADDADDAPLDAQSDAATVIAILSQALAARLPSDLDPYQRPGAAITIYSAARRELWQVGDVGFWHEGRPVAQEQPHKSVDAIAIAMRIAILRAELIAGADPAELARNDVGRAAVLPLLTRQTRFGNNPEAGDLAYGVLDGRPVPPQLISVTAIPEDVGEIAIASDGYPRILPTLAQTEAALQEMLAADPLCIGPLAGTKGIQPGHVSFDDRSYLRLAL